MRKYDYLIVGSGLYGSVCARELTDHGFRCLVLEKREHLGGNVYCEKRHGILVHKYGAHIFHTSNKTVWDYVNRFTEFNQYVNAPIANYKGKLYNLPFNMNTFYQMWGVITPGEARRKIQEQRDLHYSEHPANLEEQAIDLVGMDLYQKLIKGYTEKQWGKDCKDLPASIIRRVPVRYIFSNNYFNDRYQGIPIEGYNGLIEKLLSGIEVRLGTDYLQEVEKYGDIAARTIYSGPIDKFYHYCFGPLEYRSLRFEIEELPTDNYQGNAVVNYTDRETPYTRIIEHKHFEFGSQPNTVISREYPLAWEIGMEPYYPVNDENSQKLYNRYAQLAAQEKDLVFGGRLGSYRYYDMDKVVECALELSQKEIARNNGC